MLHYYDEPPESVQTQLIRLGPTRPVVEAGIPCALWAEDAMSIAHFVPYTLLGIEILVPDELLDHTCEAICKSLPYTRMAAPPDGWINYKFIDPNEGLWTTKSIPLELTSRVEDRDSADPTWVYIHPQSLYSFDVRDRSLSLTFPERYPAPFDRVRFPTLPAFMDATIATLLDPPCGFFHMKMSMMMQYYMSDMIQYTFRDELFNEDGTLQPKPRSVLRSLREENRPYLEAYFACVYDRAQGRPDWLELAKKRNAILEKLGRPTRPLPIDFMARNFSKKRELHTSSQQSTGPHVNVGPSQSRLLRPRQSPTVGRGMLLSTARNLVKRIV